MENAVDALKIAFAVFVFVMALSLAMYMFTQARETADIVLASSDITEFMDYTTIESVQEGITYEGTDRIVGLETIIPTLYRYYKENYTVIFLDSDGSPMELYTTQTNEILWSKGYTNRYYSRDTDLKKVCSFDVDEETRRHEPWTGSNYYYKQNLDMFLSGGTFTAPSGNGMNYDYSDNRINGWGNESFINHFKDSKFRESLGEYTYNNVNSEEVSGATNVKGQEKRVIIYTLIKE